MNTNNKRLTLHSAEKSLENLGVSRREFATLPRFEIAPSQFLGAVACEDGERVWRGFRWGIRPSWWDESHRLLSARAETLAQKPTFAQAFKYRRAVVPADGFWVYADVEDETGQRQPRAFLIRAKDEEPLFLAAIWEDDQEMQLAMVTVEANRLLEPFGARMPAILRGDDVNAWLEPNIVSEKPLLRALKTHGPKGLLVTATQNRPGLGGLRAAADSRECLAQIYGAAFKPEKPKFEAKRRNVLRDHTGEGHVYFRTKSFSSDDATRWHPVVDIECGHVFCDCPDFRYRHAHHEPDVWTPHWWCKHLRRAVENCRRRGELPSAPINSPE